MNSTTTNRRLLDNRGVDGLTRCVMCSWPIGDPQPVARQTWGESEIDVHAACRSAIDRERLDLLAERVKVEIVALMDDGAIPVECGSFSSLHDYMDANTLAGLCDDGDNADIDVTGLAYTQTIVDRWLKAARPGLLATDFVKIMRTRVMPSWTAADWYADDNDAGGEMDFVIATDRDLSDDEHAALRYSWELLRDDAGWLPSEPVASSEPTPSEPVEPVTAPSSKPKTDECRFCDSLIDWEPSGCWWLDSSGAYRCEENDVDCCHVPKRTA